MRLVFMGSPDFAVPALRSLVNAGQEIVAVYCQPPRPAGRGQSLQPCPVQRVAEELGLPVHYPARLRGNAEALAAFQALDADAAVVAAYGLILPRAWLEAPKRGCINIHASLLPRWRGAAPIHAAILAGDAETGVTIMQMDEGLDTGPMLMEGRVAIGPRTRLPEVHDALAAIGADLILKVLETNPAPVPQPDSGSTYAPRLSRGDAKIDWSKPAAAIERQIRAFDPWPGTFTTMGADQLKVLDAELADGQGEPGTVLDGALTIACGEGALRITRLQRAGRAPAAAADFLRGFAVPPGTKLSA
ncbi:methionyl-tRNA formyltransferase [Acidisoma cellulosilytica]|uniref:Methionyl-tRNA formyltransferase n=1 Tax=Acidisoma cellulosilyticum TaxID=2802395 RepID=A0A963Z088_9PROT|nr:methionyl-tRNA formyltransferase [Acidisoma cellulosilyticum]MCB8880324.1 methionyl-tRNA formyltransferase [Acidisoma cellulosilyticum]